MSTSSSSNNNNECTTIKYKKYVTPSHKNNYSLWKPPSQQNKLMPIKLGKKDVSFALIAKYKNVPKNANNNEKEAKTKTETDNILPGWVYIRKHNGKIEYKYGKETLNDYLEKDFIRRNLKHDKAILHYLIARQQWDQDRENDHLGDLSRFHNDLTVQDRLSKRTRYIKISNNDQECNIYDSEGDNNENIDDDDMSDNGNMSDNTNMNNIGNNNNNNNTINEISK
jgi:hypothetical protein